MKRHSCGIAAVWINKKIDGSARGMGGDHPPESDACSNNWWMWMCMYMCVDV